MLSSLENACIACFYRELKGLMMTNIADQKTEKELKDRIRELEAENKKLKLELKKLKTGKEGFYTLNAQFDNSVDLGEFTNKLPSFIPDHKKWSANDYPNDWSPEKKASEYLVTFWKNYPVSQSFFSNVRGGQSFYKYLKRNDLFRLVPDSFQVELKRRLNKIR
jgi:hypothetical protein